MFLPLIPYTSNKVTQQIVQFGTIRYDRNGSEGDFSETLNLSSDQFPALSQRKGRSVYKAYEKATALYARGKMIVVDGTNFIYDGVVKGQVTEGEKNITSVNSKIVIFPDKKYYDVEKDKFGDMDVSVKAAAGNVRYSTDTITISGAATPLNDLFDVGQGVEISNSSIAANNKTSVIRSVTANSITFSANSLEASGESNEITVRRKVPDLVCICESANRLWGAENNTIYASALGDPLTFFAYDGLATDSYAVAVGTAGEFTGCISYSSNVLLFKENSLHKVLGASPAEYRIYDYTVPGVQKGSEKSMVVINEVLFYKGVSGVYAYSGASPSLISENFGMRRFKNAASGSNGKKYYISMQEDGSELWDLYVFDTESGIWIREDDTHAIDFAQQDTVLYFLNAADGDIYTVDQGEEHLEWMALLYPFDETVYGKRGYSKLWMKIELGEKSWIKIEISSDGGPFRQVGIWKEKTESFSVPVFPGRCDSFRVKLTGRGTCVVKNLVREFDVGSER